MKTFDRPIVIQRKDQEKRQWIRHLVLHAHINTTSSNEYTTAGSTRSSQSLTFTVRYNPALKEIAHALQDYRIVWDGGFYRINSYDDFGLGHQTVKMVAEHHGLCEGRAAGGLIV